jgi:hypothetical protein
MFSIRTTDRPMKCTCIACHSWRQRGLGRAVLVCRRAVFVNSRFGLDQAHCLIDLVAKNAAWTPQASRWRVFRLPARYMEPLPFATSRLINADYEVQRCELQPGCKIHLSALAMPAPRPRQLNLRQPRLTSEPPRVPHPRRANHPSRAGLDLGGAIRAYQPEETYSQMAGPFLLQSAATSSVFAVEGRNLNHSSRSACDRIVC